MIKLQEIQQNAVHNFRIRERERPQPFVKVGHYLIGSVLGKGGFATVYKAIQIYTKIQVAVKVVQLEDLTKKQIQQLKMEISINKNLNHPNIVRIYETVWTENRVYIFMELIKGKQLFQYISKQGPIQQCFAVKIFFQICSAVKYLHSIGVSHRDIKTQNIMIDSEFNAKLVDLGLAKEFSLNEDQFFETFCGSPSYTSPEIVQRKKYRGKQVDIWCLGVALYVMLQASLPFDQDGQSGRKQNIRSCKWDRANNSSIEAIQIYRRIFQRSCERMTIDELLSSSFFDKYLGSKKAIHISLSDQEYAEQINQNFDTRRRIGNWLNLSESQVKMILLQKELSPAYCLYQLLRKNDLPVMQNKSLRLSNDKVRESSSRVSRRTLIPKKEMISTPKNRRDVSQRATQIKMIPTVATIQDECYPDKKIGGTPKEKKLKQRIWMDKQKETIGIRNKFKSKHSMVAKFINLEMPKPRLREESPESPKRIIDCIKRYN